MLKLIPIIGAVIGAAIAATIDGDHWRGAMIGGFVGGVAVPAALWGLWAAVCKIFDLRVQ